MERQRSMAQQPERVDSFGLGRSPTPDNAGLQHIALAKMLESADVSVGGTRAPHSLLSGQPPLPSSIGEATNRVALDPSPPYQSHDPSPPPPTNFQIAVPVAVAPPTQPLPLRRYPTPSSPDYLGDQEMTAGTTTPAQTTTTFLDRPEPVFVAAPPTLDPGSPGNHTDGGLSAASIASPRPPMRPSLIHDIALHAHALFSTPRSTPQRMDLSRRLSSLLHRVTPQHLQPSPMVANVEYYPIFESDMFTICAFALRAGASMPVHDHPEMNVFSKVVHGTLHIRSYRLLSHPAPQALSATTFAQPAQITLDADIPHTHPASLQEIDAAAPGASGLHSFRAVSDGVLVLDVIGPPYAGERPCRYYREASEDEVINLALPTIAGSAKLGSRRPGNSSDEEMWGERSSKVLRISSSSRKAGKSQKKRRERRPGSSSQREFSARPRDVTPTTMDGWVAFLQTQANRLSDYDMNHQRTPTGLTAPALGTESFDFSAASLPPPSAAAPGNGGPSAGSGFFAGSDLRWDAIDNSTGSIASLEGQLNSWAIEADSPRVPYGGLHDAAAAASAAAANFAEYSTMSLPDALRPAGGSGVFSSAAMPVNSTTDRGPHGRSMLGTSLGAGPTNTGIAQPPSLPRSRTYGAGRSDNFGARANARALSRGFSAGAGPTAWAMGQGNVGACLWLLEDPEVDYDCTEREYTGEMVYLEGRDEMAPSEPTEETRSEGHHGEVPIVVVDLS